MRLNQLQEKLTSNFSEATKVEMDRVKKELAKIVCKKKKHEELWHVVRHDGTSSVKRTRNISTTWKK